MVEILSQSLKRNLFLNQGQIVRHVMFLSCPSDFKFQPFLSALCDSQAMANFLQTHTGATSDLANVLRKSASWCMTVDEIYQEVDFIILMIVKYLRL